MYKNKIFFSIIILFLIVSPSVVLYSKGYRIDFDKFNIVQTGSFYFKINPKNSEILILEKDFKINRKTDLFFGTIYIENLIPKKYSVTIKKEGYYPWKKNLKINQGVVTKAENITLIPRKIDFTSVENVIDFFTTEKDFIFILKENDNEWSLVSYNLTDNKKSLLLSSSDTNLNNSSDLKVISSNDNKILGSIKKNGNDIYFVIEDKKDVFFIDKKTKVKINPNKEHEVLYIENDTLFSYDYKKYESYVISEKITSYEIDDRGVVFLISENNILTENEDLVLELPKKLKQENIELYIPKTSNMIIKENNNYYSVENELLFISENKPIISPDYNKIAYFNDHELRLFSIDKINEEVSKKYGNDIFLTRFSEEIKSIYWINSDYIALNTKNGIKIVEIDNRDNLNIVDLIVGLNKKMGFDISTKKIFFLSNQTLFISKSPIY
jgi:hypothetical protein